MSNSHRPSEPEIRKYVSRKYGDYAKARRYARTPTQIRRHWRLTCLDPVVRRLATTVGVVMIGLVCECRA